MTLESLKRLRGGFEPPSKVDLFRTNYYEQRLLEAKLPTAEKEKWDKAQKAFNGENNNESTGTEKPPESVEKGESTQQDLEWQVLQRSSQLEGAEIKLMLAKEDLSVKQGEVNQTQKELKTAQQDQNASLRKFAEFLTSEGNQNSAFFLETVEKLPRSAIWG